MRELIKSELARVLERDVVVEAPKDRSLGHFATPVAMSLARELRKAPKIIAEELSAKFDGHENLEVSALNGYINIHLKGKFLNKLATDALNRGVEFAKGAPKSGSTMIEYVSANPTGPLHIGHVRGAVFGDTLARLGRYLGYEIATEYYINDAGNQIEMLGNSVVLACRELRGEVVEYGENDYKGDYIKDCARAAMAHFGEAVFDETKFSELCGWAKDQMLALIRQNLADAHITIDNWVSESSLYGALDATIARLKECGGTYEQDGKIWLASSQKGDEKDRVVVRDDGRPTYLAGDIVYHHDKLKRGFDHYINIWGADHHGYIARVKAAIAFLGYDPARLEVILAQMVALLKNGEAYKMSKRAGNFILMSDVLAEIGADALRYIFISKKCDTALEFDVDALKKQDPSNPIFYVNYAHARVHQLFSRAGKSPESVADADISVLDSDAQNLAFMALSLPDVLGDAFEARALQKIPDYLKALCAEFHRIYTQTRVIGHEHEDALLKVFSLVALSVRTALSLMGIAARDKMEH